MITICFQFFDVRQMDFQIIYLSSNLHLAHAQAVVKIDTSHILLSLWVCELVIID